MSNLKEESHGLKIIRKRYSRLPPSVIDTDQIQTIDRTLKLLNLPKMRILYWDPLIQFKIPLNCPFHEHWCLKFTDVWVSDKREMRVLFDLDGIIHLDCRYYTCDINGRAHNILSSDEGILKTIRNRRTDINIPFQLYLKSGVTTKLHDYFIHRYV